MRKKVTQSKILLPDFNECEQLTGAEYHAYVRQARNFYYENYKESDLLKYIWSWMEQNGYSEQQIHNAKKNESTNLLGIVAGINCKLLLDGMPDYNEKHAEYWKTLMGTTSDLKPVSYSLHDMLEKAIACGENISEENDVTVKKTNKNDRILEQAKQAATAIDEWLLSYKDPTWDVDKFDLKNHFSNHKLGSSHVKLIRSFYQKEYNQFCKLVNDQSNNMSSDEIDELNQLKESYEMLSYDQIVNFHKALSRIIIETEKFSEIKSVPKISKKSKPQQIANAVSKLSYLAHDEKNNLTSVKPETIIGSERLWIYNTRTRKLGCYVAKIIDPKGLDRGGLTIKGSTIVGFSKEKSLQKTVKNPNELLINVNNYSSSEFDVLFESLTTLDSRMNGKIDKYTLLLKVI